LFLYLGNIKHKKLCGGLYCSSLYKVSERLRKKILEKEHKTAFLQIGRLDLFSQYAPEVPKPHPSFTSQRRIQRKSGIILLWIF